MDICIDNNAVMLEDAKLEEGAVSVGFFVLEERGRPVLWINHWFYGNYEEEWEMDNWTCVNLFDGVVGL